MLMFICQEKKDKVFDEFKIYKEKFENKTGTKIKKNEI